MEEFISVEQLGELLHVSRTTAYRIAHVVPHVRIGKCIRVSRRDVDRYLRCHGNKVDLYGSRHEDGGW